MRVLCVVTGSWGERIAAHLTVAAPSHWTVAVSAFAPLPSEVDAADHLRLDSLPRAELLLSLAESAGLSACIPELAEASGAKAVLAPIDRSTWLPPGLARQLSARLRGRGVDCAFPSPFCALTTCMSQGDLINAFAARFGAQDLRLEVQAGRIAEVRVDREAPCGSTRFIADRLLNAPVDSAVEAAGLNHHYYPCLADMNGAPTAQHTLLHRAAMMTRGAVERALRTASPITCREECDHGSARLPGILER